MKLVLAWIWAIFVHMVILPVAFVLQAAITPIDMAIFMICNKTADPFDYMRSFGANMSDKFDTWTDI